MISWEDAVNIIEERKLDQLTRSPSQSASYKKAKEQYKLSHGGTAQFVLAERLKWNGDNLQSTGSPFLTHWDDTKVLPNDFSYNFENGVKHFVVWTKVLLPCGPDEFPTPEASALINEFINFYFVNECKISRNNIAWFKNTVALQSIPSVSHFHVLVRNCTDDSENRILTPRSGPIKYN